ncbi:MAG: AAA family ATPase [Oscillospiraceae bacterium]|nr:AAA family ATPase [Oscillospiraceae bacterium]
MKLVFILGDAAVGKMTVGQELMKITDLRLFHNHMTIEPVLEIFGSFDGKTISDIREVIFKNFAASNNYGMIFTMMMAFDMQSDWDYLEHVKAIFAPYGTEFYYVELIAPQEIRLKRNETENRLKHKSSKRDLAVSNRRLLKDDENHRCVSYEGEITFDNYLRIDNSEMPPEEAARLIKDTFGLI